MNRRSIVPLPHNLLFFSPPYVWLLPPYNIRCLAYCRTNGGGCGYEFCWVCGGPHPCNGGCVPPATAQWNVERSIVNNTNSTRISTSTPAVHQQMSLWTKTFNRANTHASQAADLKFITAAPQRLKPTH